MPKKVTPKPRRHRRRPRKETLELIGWNLRRLRTYRGISQEELAAEVGIHRNHLGLLERGQTPPMVATVEMLADGLEVHISELFQPIQKPMGRKD